MRFVPLLHGSARFSARGLLVAVAVFAGVVAASCQKAIPVAVLSPEAMRVSQGLQEWPKAKTADPGIKRPFFATIHIVGRRVTASGLLDFHSERDFRITAVTEMGVILFDARVNWAGVTVLREMPGLDKSIVESLVRDIAAAFTLPTSLQGLEQKGSSLVLSQTTVDERKCTWRFDPATGRMRQLDIEMGAFDTLHVDYLKFTPQGWPEEITVTRKARFYTIGITFSDGSIARRDVP